MGIVTAAVLNLGGGNKNINGGNIPPLSFLLGLSHNYQFYICRLDVVLVVESPPDVAAVSLLQFG